jgi:hypothetical protein
VTRSEIEQLKIQVKRLSSVLVSTVEKVDATTVKIDSTATRLEGLEAEVKEDRSLNMYAFADQVERSDFASNMLKTNCVLLTGMRIEYNLPLLKI